MVFLPEVYLNASGKGAGQCLNCFYSIEHRKARSARVISVRATGGRPPVRHIARLSKVADFIVCKCQKMQNTVATLRAASHPPQKKQCRRPTRHCFLGAARRESEPRARCVRLQFSCRLPSAFAGQNEKLPAVRKRCEMFFVFPAGRVLTRRKKKQCRPIGRHCFFGAGDGNRTRISSLGSWGFTTRLRLRTYLL